MAHSTDAENLRVRFAFELKLFYQLFNASYLPFGNPEDLDLFTNWLKDPGTFADDVRALLTAMVCTEGLAVNRMELLDLLCVAVGGTIADGLGTARRPALWQILLFINDVMLSTRQSPLPKTIDTPAGSAEVLPQNSECEQDTYVLERFDLPSDLTSVMSGRDLLNNKLEGAYSLAVSYGSTSVDPTLVSSVGDISGVRGSFSGTSDHLETIRPDEHPASTPLSIHSGRLTAAFEQDAYILERFDSPYGLSTITSGRDMLDDDLEGAYGEAVSCGSSSVDSLLLMDKKQGAVRTQPVQVFSIADTSTAKTRFSGTFEHLEAIQLDEHPARTPMSVPGSTSSASQLNPVWPRRRWLLLWGISVVCAVVAGFSLGVLVSRHARPCSAATVAHGAERVDVSTKPRPTNH